MADIEETPDKLLRFEVSNSLERYRVETIYSKEPETISWIKRFPEYAADLSSTFFWDIGANIGCFSLLAAKIYPKMRVLAFEPFLPNYIKVHANLRINNLSNCVPLHCALARVNGIGEFKTGDARVGASGGILQTGAAPSNTQEGIADAAPIPYFSGDTLVDHLGYQNPTFIKIDVDGIELEILAGMRGVLRNPDLRSVLIETNNDDEFAEVLQIMEFSGLQPDTSINEQSDHSTSRRAQNPKNRSRNWVFSRVTKSP